ncbi:MAG: glutathione peroxidase [Ferruginibacter sp.]|uniref:glutathione peroxidase n=1 Tax=Ferruginibacter sp. TaxID=1940288 RepID=UPI00265AD7B1|nr:glutathione peroxidase [Ferruginibacter sp.]MDB5280434.1 glutathione peroxidase [Ferruginibacter sp.]
MADEVIPGTNKKSMTIKQQLLKVFYPALMKLSGLKKDRIKINRTKTQPVVSIYTLNVLKSNNELLLLNDLKGKKILLVNTASDCGYTQQYEALEALYEKFKDKVVILAFPANDFKQQETGTDEEIASFCKINYGVSFPLMKKSQVIKGPHQNQVFNWLSDANKNGWNNLAPVWNFSKYLVDEQGVLTHYFDPSISPLGAEMLAAIG